MVKNYFQNQKTSLIFILMVIAIGILYGVAIYTGFYKNNMEEVRFVAQISMPLVALFAIGFAWRQVQANHDWNRRSLAFTELRKYIQELREYRMQLDRLTISNKIINIKHFMEATSDQDDKFISFTDRVTFYRKSDDEIRPLTPEELHKWVCQLKSNSNEIEYIMDHSGNQICKTTSIGEKIVHYILSIINTYEHIAIGIRHKVLDKNLVLDELEYAFYINYKFFEKYIKHRRKKHHDEEFATNFEKIAKKIAEKYQGGNNRKSGDTSRPPTDA